MPSESHSETVTVALVGDSKSPPPGSADWDLLCGERPKKTLDVNKETTLAEILDRAGEYVVKILGLSEDSPIQHVIAATEFVFQLLARLWDRRDAGVRCALSRERCAGFDRTGVALHADLVTLPG